jgi:hypothetical protein
MVMEKIKIKKTKGGRKMKKFLGVVVGVGLLFLGIGNASAYFTNWYFNPNGTGFAGATQIGEWLDTTGLTYIDNNFVTNTFQEWGTFVTNTHDGYASYPGGSNEITGVFNNATGILPPGGVGSFSFTSGTLSIYSDASFDYGNDDITGTPPTNPDNAFFGADNGTWIGTFNLVSGGGNLLSYVPNGTITVSFVAQNLASGYWFDPAGNDLSQWTITSGTSPILTIALGTTNASIINGIPTGFGDEVGYYIGGIYGVPAQSNPYDEFYVSNNGQFRVGITPEPSAILLLGMSLLGFGIIRRKKRA